MSASSKKKARKELEAAKLTEKQLKEQKEAKKLKAITTCFIAGICLVLVVALVVMGITFYKNSGITERNAHAITIGEHELSAAEFNYHYVDTIQNKYNEWYSSYGTYTDLLLSINERLDTTKPLNEQAHPDDEERTYADFFADLAIERVAEGYALYDAAIAAGFELTDEDYDNIDATVDALDDAYGLDNYLLAFYGKGANESNFREYLEFSTLINNYEQDHIDSLVYDADDINEYLKENPNKFTSYSYSILPIASHDLIAHEETTEKTEEKTEETTEETTPEETVPEETTPEETTPVETTPEETTPEETTPEETTPSTSTDSAEHNHTAEEEAAAMEKAEQIANQLVESGATTLEALNEAIKGIEEIKTKTASQNQEIMLVNIAREELANWLSDASRKEGELGVIPYNSTPSGDEEPEQLGYYVVLFEGKNDNQEKMVNVRHILAAFEGGEYDDNGDLIHTEEEKKAAKDKIDAVLATFEAGEKTEDNFAALVAENSDDGGSVNNGGLYENVFHGQMLEAFDAWCFDSARKAGDYDIVETESGYHLIYFVSVDEDTYRDGMIKGELRSEAHTAWFDEICKDAVSKASELDMTYLSTNFIIANYFGTSQPTTETTDPTEATE